MLQKALITTLLVALGTHAASAQNLTDVLATVEQGNTQLRAAKAAAQAEIAEMQADITPGPTSVEYSPFFHKGYRGIAASELIVTQEFDLPALNKAKRRGVGLQNDVLDLDYRILRRDILLEAANTWFDLCTARQRLDILRQRQTANDTLMSLYNRRLDHGYATAMELNRVKLDRMNLNTEVAECQSEMLTLSERLQSLAGGTPVITATPAAAANAPALSSSAAAPAIPSTWTTTASTDANLETTRAEAALTASRHNLNLTRKTWYPTFTAGFRVNTEQRDANGGFVVGLAFPLFSNGKKQQAARMRHTANELALVDAHQNADNRSRSLSATAQTLQSVLATYDVDLMRDNLSTLMHATESGEVSIIEYYTEAERIYSILQQRLATENTYNKTMAELNRDKL